MTTFGHRFMYKLNEWWHEEGVDRSVCFFEDNGTILVQHEHEYTGIIYWIGADVLTIALQPTYEHHQTIRIFLLRTLSTFLGPVAIRCAQPANTYNI